MAHVALTAVRAWQRLPLALRIAAVYLAARIVTTVFLLQAAASSTSLSRFGVAPGLADFVLGWDAQWYWLIAVEGYPSVLETTAAGAVAENQWAFMPVFPVVAQAVGLVFGSWGVGAFLVSFVSGYLACLALHRLLRDRIGAAAALWAVVFFASGPLAALFQVGYAESLFLLLLLLALDAAQRRRYARLYPLILVMAFTRPGILAFALFLGLHGIVRWVRRRHDPLPRRDIAHIVATGALATVSGFAWQVVAGVVTGDMGAYLETELAWRQNWIAGGVDGFVPFEGWVQAASFWFTLWGLPSWAGLVALALLVMGAALALLRLPPVRALGPDVRLWSASYLLYLLAVFFPQSSVFRLLLPLSPLWGAMAVPRRWGWRLGVLALCLIGQAVWIHFVYASGNTFWQVP